MAFAVGVAVSVAVAAVGVELEKWRESAMFEKETLGYFRTERSFVFAWQASQPESS